MTDQTQTATQTESIRIYLVHRQRFFRDALRNELKEDDSLRLIGYSRNASQAIHRKVAQTADLVLFEIDETVDWIDGLRRVCENLREVSPDVPVVALGAETDAQIAQAIAAGSYGGISAKATSATLCRELRALHARRPAIRPGLASALLDEIRRLHRPPKPPELTPRQREILALMEFSNEEIARRLGLKLATVKTHVHAVLSRMGARDRRHALILARQFEDFLKT